MRTTAVLPDLVTATLAISLWFAPKDLAIANTNIGRLMRSTGYASSMVFYAKSYLTLFFNYSRFDAQEKKQAIAEDVELELYEFRKEQRLQIEKVRIEHEAMKELQPIFISMRSLEEESESECNNEKLTEEQKLSSAQKAIEQALAPTVITAKYSEKEIRASFPESTDNTYWKACLKALQAGHSKEEIAVDVLGCKANKELGIAYFELLKSRFM